MDEKDRYLKLEDVNLHYRVAGKGETMILLHGNGENLHIFDAMTRELAVSREVIRIDSREHGLSVLSPAGRRRELDFAGMSRDLFALMDKRKIDQAVLLGFSDGANTALTAASLKPERVKAVISVSGNANPAGMCFSAFLPCFLEYYLLKLPELLLPGRERQQIRKQRRLLRLMLKHPHLSAERLHRIKAPVLILTGDRDMIRPSHSRWMKEQIPHAEIRFVKGADHFSMFGRTAEYLRYIEAFLSEI